jgi:hypothetical protein
MLRLAIEYKTALTVMLNNEVELNDYQLNDTEWRLAEELCDVLKVCSHQFSLSKSRNAYSYKKIFREATIYASRNTTSVADVIPTMDRIHTLLSAQNATCAFSDIILTALRPGMKTLERYHNKANVSKVYRISTSEYFL